MSHIPNSAIPHAVAHDVEEPTPAKGFVQDVAARLKAAPVGAIVAGVAVVGGIAAAAAVPFLRTTPEKKPAAKRRRSTKASTTA